MKRIAFIINPISGTKSKYRIPESLQNYLDHSIWEHQIVFTSRAGQATELASSFVQQGYEAVVAIGGDGTLNEVAQSLIHTNTALGIIPLGSGNGFARHLKISRNIKDAIDTLNHGELIAVDYGMANEHFFLSTCGTGFDATIAEKFSHTKKRGLVNYLKYIFGDVFKYKPEKYRIRSVDDSQMGIIEGNLGKGFDISNTAFLVTFANSNQWGYGAQIAPKASVQDGLMEVCIMSRFAILGSLNLAIELFTKNINHDFFLETIRAKDVYIERETASPFHIDGDSVEMPANIRVRIVENGLKVIVNKQF